MFTQKYVQVGLQQRCDTIKENVSIDQQNFPTLEKIGFYRKAIVLFDRKFKLSEVCFDIDNSNASVI